ncbi:MAG: T9SS type A sorting domain-containing protein [Flavobacteriales bacterium]|nr:T9SS type A sorting domain-containing protein [Flavobacteriales bacterium]MBK6883408.1 T9SS type A sorting domain-containing protein [Flavobacteriales bacterium]MBK7103053.1 T9SS type A sorting domain-containing protein [Flavobacteriales bacterium]MBK8708649.1 T9SS type A sorting domain-containing protein [Flavobacteriales bacterium]
MNLNIEVGDMVTWTNIDGSHNVYGEPDAYPNNPEGFSNSADPIGDLWTWPYTFTIPGVYGYHCTGSFQGQFHSTTQFGTITVLEANSIEERSPWGELSIYPVPAHRVLNVAIATTERLTIEVYSPDGRMVRSAITSGNTPIQLDLSDEATGRYMLRLIDQHVRMTTRAFVKS